MNSLRTGVSRGIHTLSTGRSKRVHGYVRKSAPKRNAGRQVLKVGRAFGKVKVTTTHTPRPPPPLLDSDQDRQDRVRVIVAALSIYEALENLVKINDVHESLSRKLRVYMYAVARKHKLRNVHNASMSVVALAFTVVELLEKIGITLDVVHVKLVLSTELDTVLRLVKGNSHVDLTPLILALLTKLGSPLIDQIRDKVKRSSSASFFEELCDKLVKKK